MLQTHGVASVAICASASTTIYGEYAIYDHILQIAHDDMRTQAYDAVG